MRGTGSPLSWYSLEPLGEEQGGEEKQREQDRQHQADEFRGSQPLDQLLYPAEQREDRHRQHDVHHDGHVVSCSRHVYGPPDFGGLDPGSALVSALDWVLTVS